VPNRDGRHGEPSRDFAGQGLANVASGLFGGAVVGGSVQATAINVGAGARSRWSSVFAGAVVLLVVLAAAPLVARIPVAVTAGILIVAGVSAVRPHAIRAIWLADRLSAVVMALTFVFVLVMPLQYAVLAGAALSVLKYVYLSSLDVRVVRVVIDAGGRCRETSSPAMLADGEVTLLDIYGSLFFAAGPKLRASLPAAEGARRAVVVLRLRGRGTLQAATIALLRGYAAELAAGGGRLYLAGVGPEMAEQLRRTGLVDVLGEDAVVPATDEYFGACEAAQRRGRAWLEAQPGTAATGVTAPRPPRTRPRPTR
jgi:SulP family sulfate permease